MITCLVGEQNLNRLAGEVLLRRRRPSLHHVGAFVHARTHAPRYSRDEVVGWQAAIMRAPCGSMMSCTRARDEGDLPHAWGDARGNTSRVSSHARLEGDARHMKADAQHLPLVDMCGCRLPLCCVCLSRLRAHGLKKRQNGRRLSVCVCVCVCVCVRAS